MLQSNKQCPCFDSSFSSLIMVAYPDLTMFELPFSFLFVRRSVFSKSSAKVQATCAVWHYLKTKHSQESLTRKQQRADTKKQLIQDFYLPTLPILLTPKLIPNEGSLFT